VRTEELHSAGRTSEDPALLYTRAPVMIPGNQDSGSIFREMQCEREEMVRIYLPAACYSVGAELTVCAWWTGAWSLE
jgi:hypothetical protein